MNGMSFLLADNVSVCESAALRWDCGLAFKRHLRTRIVRYWLSPFIFYFLYLIQMRNSQVRKNIIDTDEVYREIYGKMKVKGVLSLKLRNFVKFYYGNVCRIRRFDLDQSHPSVLAIKKDIDDFNSCWENGEMVREHDYNQDLSNDFHRYKASLSNGSCYTREVNEAGYPIAFLVFYKANGQEVKAKHDNDAPFISILRVFHKSL